MPYVQILQIRFCLQKVVNQHHIRAEGYEVIPHYLDLALKSEVFDRICLQNHGFIPSVDPIPFWVLLVRYFGLFFDVLAQWVIFFKI